MIICNFSPEINTDLLFDIFKANDIKYFHSYISKYPQKEISDLFMERLERSCFYYGIDKDSTILNMTERWQYTVSTFFIYDIDLDSLKTKVEKTFKLMVFI